MHITCPILVCIPQISCDANGDIALKCGYLPMLYITKTDSSVRQVLTEGIHRCVKTVNSLMDRSTTDRQTLHFQKTVAFIINYVPNKYQTTDTCLQQISTLKCVQNKKPSARALCSHCIYRNNHPLNHLYISKLLHLLYVQLTTKTLNTANKLQLYNIFYCLKIEGFHQRCDIKMSLQ